MKKLKIYSIVITIVAIVLLCVVIDISVKEKDSYSINTANSQNATNVDETVTSNSTNTTGDSQTSTATDNTTVSNQGTSSEYIGIDAAKEIALADAGFTSSDVTWGKSELDVDWDVAKYELEFYYGYVEYDYEINAITGEIIKYEID